MTDTAAVYLERAAECFRQAQRCDSPAERENWLAMHAAWLELAKGAGEAASEPLRGMDGFPVLPDSPPRKSG